MDKSCLVWIVLILIIGGGAIAYSNIKSNEAAEKKKVERKKEIADSIAQAKKDAESKKPCNRVGKYVYVDQVGVLHTELHCGAINEGGTLSGYATDEDGDDVDVSRSIKCGSGVKRILLKDMDKSLLKKSCHICIDDDMYEFLIQYGVSAKSRFSIHEKKKITGVDWVSDSDDKSNFTEDDIDPEVKRYANAKALAKKYGF